MPTDDAIARGREWVVGHAEPQRRLGRVRRRQHLRLSEPHPVRRSRRAARSADRRCHRALRRRCWRSSATTRATSRALARGDRLSAREPGDGRQLVRPLGHELHLRHLVGAVRAQRRRRRPAALDGAQGRRLAASRSRTRDGGWGEDGESYRLDYTGYEPAPSTRVADRLGAARPDGGGRGRPSGGRRAASPIWRARRAQDGVLGRSSVSPRPVSRASSICAITAIAKFFPLWALARYRNLKAANSQIGPSGCNATVHVRGFGNCRLPVSAAEARIADARRASSAVAAGGDATRLAPTDR